MEYFEIVIRLHLQLYYTDLKTFYLKSETMFYNEQSLKQQTNVLVAVLFYP